MGTKEKLQQIIALHYSMKGCYFYHSPSSAGARRSYERQHSLETEFSHDGHLYRIEQKTTCSCANVYYSILYYEDGERINKDIRFIKKLQKYYSAEGK